MLFTAHIPPYPLSRFIECFWHVSGTTPYHQEKVLPTKTIELMFNLGAPHKVYDNRNLQTHTLFVDAWISGLHTECIVMEAMAETNIYGIRFKPGGAYPFFNLPLLEFKNQVVEMDLVWGQLINEIRETLYEAQTPEDRFKYLEAILLARLKSDLYGFEAIEFVANTLAHSNGMTTIKSLSNQAGLSQKHLNDQFKKMVGLSPKQFGRVLKFNHVLESIDPTQPVNWTDIALQCQYYDQAHFNKDFMAFSGFTPSQYLNHRTRFWDDTLTQGDFVNFVPIR